MDTRLSRRPIMRTLSLLLMLTAFAAMPAAAQSLNPGSTVRLRSGPITGEFTVLEATPELLIVRSRRSATEHSIPMEAVWSLERLVEIPRAERVQRGARRGLVIGGAVSFLTFFGMGVALQQYDPSYEDFAIGETFTTAVVAGAFGGLAGLGIGSIAGAGPRERWQHVPLVQGVAVRADPRALTLGYAVTF
jgi:hypothetical protein